MLIFGAYWDATSISFLSSYENLFMRILVLTSSPELLLPFPPTGDGAVP